MLEIEPVINLLATLAEEENLQVAVTNSLLGGLVAGTATILGGLLMGPVGLAVGMLNDNRIIYTAQIFLSINC